MNLNDLPLEILTRCFSHLSTELLIDIILLEDISDHILQAAADNLNHLWYSNRVQDAENIQRRGEYFKTSFDKYDDQIALDRYHYETDFDWFLRIHKILEKKSIRCPLWFHYDWRNIFQIHRNLDEINLAYNGQKLGIHADIHNPAFQSYPIFPDHEMNLKITYLSLSSFCSIDLDNFPKLETFKGVRGETKVDYDHPSLKNLYLDSVTFSSLPVNLKKLVAIECHITMKENHPKLEALTVLTLEHTREPFDPSAMFRILWNKDLEHLSYFKGSTTEDEVLSMLGPKLTSLKFSGSISAKIPRSLRSLYTLGTYGPRDLITFTHMTSLTLSWTGQINKYELPPKLLNLSLEFPGEIESLKFPPSLVKLAFRKAKFKDLAKVEFPPKIVDLELQDCAITSTAGWLKPALLKRLSLYCNQLSSFHAVLPCCEYLSLRENTLTEVEIEAPVLKHINLSENKLTSIPKLPDSLQVLILSENKSDLSQMSELPSNLKLLDLSGDGFNSGTAFQNYTFPSSIQELNLRYLDLSGMSGVKFAKESRLKVLDMSRCRLETINDMMIELPLGLKSLQLQRNYLKDINTLTIPQTVTFLDLGENRLESLKVMSHIETLYLNENRLSSLTIPKDSELNLLHLDSSGLEKFSFDMFGAERLTELLLGSEFKEIDFSKMPVNFQILYYPGNNEIAGLHRYPKSRIWRPDSIISGYKDGKITLPW